MTADARTAERADGDGRRSRTRWATGSRAASGFRRAFLELVVVEKPADGDGRSGSSGRRAGRTSWACWSAPTASRCRREFFDRDPATGKQAFQPHHEVITSPDQVQVYETLLRNAKGRFTTSFVRGCESVKDNRLLAAGLEEGGPRRRR